MSGSSTPHSRPISDSSASLGATVVMSRRYVAVVVLLIVVPLPLLSLGAMVVPMPPFLERATAQFMSIVTPVLASDAVLRESAAAPKPVTITYDAAESSSVLARRLEMPAADPQIRVRGTAAKRGGQTRAAPAATPKTRLEPNAPQEDAGASSDLPGGAGDKTSTDGETPHGDPGDGAPNPAPPTPPSGGGTTDGGGAGAGGTGAGGSTSPAKPGHREGGQSQPEPPDPGSGAGSGPRQDEGGPGSGTGSNGSPPSDPGPQNGSPPSEPPGGGSPPSDGRGRP